MDEVGAHTEKERDPEQRREYGERGPRGGGRELFFVWWWRRRRRRRQAHSVGDESKMLRKVRQAAHDCRLDLWLRCRINTRRLKQLPNIPKSFWTTGMPASRSSSPTKPASAAAVDGAGQQGTATAPSDHDVALQGLREELTSKHTAKAGARHPCHTCSPAVRQAALSPRALVTSGHSGDRGAQHRASGHDGGPEGGARRDT